MTFASQFGDLLGVGAAGQVQQAIYRPLNVPIAVKVNHMQLFQCEIGFTCALEYQYIRSSKKASADE